MKYNHTPLIVLTWIVYTWTGLTITFFRAWDLIGFILFAIGTIGLVLISIMQYLDQQGKL